MKRHYDNQFNDEISDDDEWEPPKKKLCRKKCTEVSLNNKNKYDIILNELEKREITLNHILGLDLPLDEYIWFVEYLHIYDSLDGNTEEKFKIKNLIYQRYMQLKEINHKKLDKIKMDSGVDVNIVTKIINSQHSDFVKAILYKKYKRVYDNPNTSDEIFKVLEWIDNVLDLPTKVNNCSTSSIDDKLKKLWGSLNSNISGLIHVKEKVMEAMCSKLLDPDNKGKIITLVGPPGVGKTAIAYSIAESLEMPFDQISFGSIKDSVMLTGHSATYVGATPGLFAKILLKSGRLDTLVLLDELDKIPNTVEGKSISSVLLHVLDRTQNHRFRDMYMPEIVIDLSKMMFILAVNSVDTVDPVLLDRMNIIEILGYSVEEKIIIVKEHILPRIKSELKFKSCDIIFDDDLIRYLIVTKTGDNLGMRNTERAIYQLCERLSLLKYVKNITFSYGINKLKFPLVITKNIIDNLVDPA